MSQMMSFFLRQAEKLKIIFYTSIKPKVRSRPEPAEIFAVKNNKATVAAPLTCNGVSDILKGEGFNYEWTILLLVACKLHTSCQ